MGDDKLQAAKRRYDAGVRNELDPDELGRIALIVEQAARDGRDFEAARHYAELAVQHYRGAGDAGRVVRAQRRLAGALLRLQDWARALPLVDEVGRAPDERDVELPKAAESDEPKSRALELGRALVAWASATNPAWVVIWGALFDAFSHDPVARELERRFANLLGRRNADVARKLSSYGFHDAALRAADRGAKSTRSSGADWLERGKAQEARGELAAAYESYWTAAECFEKAYDRSTNTYRDEEVDSDTARYLAGEDRFDHRASEAWRAAASCAFDLGSRSKMTAAYDRELLRRFDRAEREALAALRAAVAQERTSDALELVNRTFRYSRGGTPEIRGLLARNIEEHVAAKRYREAVAVHDGILDAIATTWGETSGAYLAARLDLARMLLEIGWIGEARPIVAELTAEVSDLDADHSFMKACVAARGRIEAGKDLELLECVHTRRFETARERWARMRELLAAGASLSAADAAGDTVLHYAARLRTADAGWLVRALLAAGANRETKNAAGETALAVAARNPSQVVDAVEALWVEGASWALELAATHGNHVTVARLHSLGAASAPSVGARPMPDDAQLVEFALRVAAATGDASLVDSAFSGTLGGAEPVRRQLSAFCAHGGVHAMHLRFGGPEADKLVAELVYTIASHQILETLLSEDWPRFVREDLGLLRAAIPADVEDALGDEEQLLRSLELDFRCAAFDVAPPAIRDKAKRVDFGKADEAAPAQKKAPRRARKSSG
jgi:hypothetical protein